MSTDESIAVLTVPEVAQQLGVRDREVRGMLADRSLVALRRIGGGPAIPADFLTVDSDGEPAVVPGLRGTVIQLSDAGYSDAETVTWLFAHNDELDSTPIEALRQLRTHAVRRAAQTLAF